MTKRILPLLVAVSWAFIAEGSLAATVNQVYYDAKRNGIVIKFSGPIRASHRQIDGPNRLVIDLSNATMHGITRHFQVHKNAIKEVRTAQYSISPSVVRVVAELNSPIFPSLTARAGEIFVALNTSPEPMPKPSYEITLNPDPVLKPIATPTPIPSVKPVATPRPKPRPTPTPVAEYYYPPAEATYSTIPTLPRREEPVATPMPTPTPIPLPTPEPVTTPEPTPAVEESAEPTPTQCPRSSSLQWLMQQIVVNEGYPITAEDGTVNGSGTTFGVLSDIRGLQWRHWLNDYVGLDMQGRYAIFNVLDKASGIPSQRTETIAQTALAFRLPLAFFQPELQIGFRYHDALVEANPDIQDANSYPALGNMKVMGPVAGIGARFQFFEPLALVISGQFTPMTTSSSDFSGITPLVEMKTSAGVLLDLNPIQLSLGGTMETVMGASYTQTNSGVLLGAGFAY